MNFVDKNYFHIATPNDGYSEICWLRKKKTKDTFLLNGTHPALLHSHPSSLHFLFREVKKILQVHQWCHETIQCFPFMTTLQYIIQQYTQDAVLN